MNDADKFNNTKPLTSLSCKRLTEHQCISLGMDICTALESYAQINVIHRGVRPENIFFSKSGTYELGELGGESADSFTAPELLSAQGADARADIYSLGMTMYYFLCGRAPIRNPDALENMSEDERTTAEFRHAFFDDMPMPSSISEQLAAIIKKATARDPEQRFESVAEMKSALMTIYASKYFDGITVTSGDSVSEGGEVAAIRRSINDLQLSESKRRERQANELAAILKNSGERMQAWEDTVVVHVPDSDGFEEKTSEFYIDTSTSRVRSADDYIYEYEDSEDDRRAAAIAAGASVTEAARLAHQSAADSIQRSDRRRTNIVLLTVALLSLLLLTGIIVAAVFMADRIIGGPSDSETELQTPQSLEIVTMPTKLTYTVGENISAQGLVLEVLYASGEREEIREGFEITPVTADKAGTVSVSVTYSGIAVTYDVEVVQRQVAALYLERLPDRREFAVGEALVLEGFMLDVLYEGGSHEILYDGFEIFPTSFDEIGEQKVTVSYGGKSVSFIVNVVENSVESIEVLTSPEKLDYYVGESFDTAGLRLYAAFTNGTAAEISSGFEVSPERFTKAGKQSVTVTYGEKSTEFEVNVIAANLTRLTVRTMPSKTSYTVGETLVMRGFSLWAHYDNGTSSIITKGYTCDLPTFSEAGVHSVSVSYRGKSISFDVNVTEPVPTVTAIGISVATPPKRSDYVVGDSLESDGLCITVHYSDGSTETLTEGFTCSPAVFTESGKAAVKVSYGGFDVSFIVTVSEPVVESGTCGAKAQWTLVGGVLTVSGSGDIDDFSENGAPWYKHSAQIKTVTVESGIASIGAYAFAGTPVETLNLPDTLRRLDKTALYNTSRLALIRVDSANRSFIYKDGSLISLDGTKLYAIAFGRYVSKYTIPEGVTSIEAYRLFYGSHIREIVITKDLYSIDPTTFEGADMLEKISIKDYNSALCTVDGVLYTKNMNALVCYPAAKAATSYTVPEGVTVIRQSAFANNDTLTSLTLPSTLRRVDAYAFRGANTLLGVTYNSSEAAWKEIDIGAGNEALTDAPVTYSE